MFIKKLILKNFRNYARLSAELSPNMNFIIGDNGTGKTNILEAISVAANLKSFRGVHDTDIVLWGEQSYFCHVDLDDTRYAEFEIGCAIINGKVKKRAKIDGVEVRKASDYFGRLLTVIFSPGDIAIITGAPEIRRKFIDGVISRIDVSYLDHLQNFKRILVSRNRVLKSLQDGKSFSHDELFVWDSMYADICSILIGERIKFIRSFYPVFYDAYARIADGERPPGIQYLNNTRETDSSAIMKQLVVNRKNDIATGSTGMGPQRDDYVFADEHGRVFNNYASQGQKRTAAIALKNAEAEIIETKRQDKVILMVDDIFSELDSKRRKCMIEILKGKRQVIFTMANILSLDSTGFEADKRFIIQKSGQLREA